MTHVCVLANPLEGEEAVQVVKAGVAAHDAQPV